MRSEDWDAKFAASEFLFTDRPNQTLVAEVAELPVGRALDLGAGQGRNAVWLAERGWQVTAVDFSPVGLERAETLAAAKGVKMSFVLADAREWEPPVEAFELALVAYLQLPESELRAVLTGAAAAVAPGGTLLVVGHDRDNLTRGTGGPQDPDVLYTVDGVVTTLSGLRVDKAEQFARLVDTELGPMSAIDTVVRGT
ncbi:MAG: class I SAM-dependent methyltransferase, partial [Haloechinothrix sp.]